MENAIIELLRYGSFGKMPFFRFATDDIEFGGQLIKKGQGIGVNIQAAWHDPGQVGEPEHARHHAPARRQPRVRCRRALLHRHLPGACAGRS